MLELDVIAGSDQELEGVEAESLALWGALNKGCSCRVTPPENRKELIVSLIKTSKLLFGPDFCDASRHRSKSKKHGFWTATRYTVNPAWRERHLALFKLSFHSLSDKVDDVLATRYGLKPQDVDLHPVQNGADPNP